MKKILSLILCGILVLGITGCGNSEIVDENNNDSSNSNLQEENNPVVEKTYYCDEKDDDDWYYYFYYENNELVKVKVLAAKWTGLFEDYSEIKADAMTYDGVDLSKDSDYIYFDIDIKTGGLKYLTESFTDLKPLENDSSWTKVNEIMNNSYGCHCEER